jgi:hypothetical protein
MRPSMAASNRTGALVVRIWLESESGDAALRARITQVLDLSAPVATTSGAVNEQEVLDAVRAWLDAFTAAR